LKVSREPLENIVIQAQDEIDRLYAVLRLRGYVVLLCNREGVAIHHRGDEAKAGEFKHWGIWAGGVWSEEAEGTNGIGTCIAEQAPLLVHADQHFRSRHTQLTCAGAPVFDPQGELVAVLDVSRVASGEDQCSLPLVLDTVTFAARAIEERLFREHFRHAWTIAALPSDNEPALLVAVDEHQWMLGADRIARDILGLDDDKLGSDVLLSAALEFDRSLGMRMTAAQVKLQVILEETAFNRRSAAATFSPLAQEVVHRAAERLGHVGLALISPPRRLPVVLAEPEVQIGEVRELHGLNTGRRRSG